MHASASAPFSSAATHREYIAALQDTGQKPSYRDNAHTALLGPMMPCSAGMRACRPAAMMYIYIYIYIYNTHICICTVYIYIYIYSLLLLMIIIIRQARKWSTRYKRFDRVCRRLMRGTRHQEEHDEDDQPDGVVPAATIYIHIYI